MDEQLTSAVHAVWLHKLFFRNLSSSAVVYGVVRAKYLEDKRYEVNGDKLAITSPLGSTRMACPEPIMKQEQAFLQTLQSAERYEIKGDSLRLSCADDQVLFFTAK